MRLDKYIATNYNLSRKEASELNKLGRVLVNNKQVKDSYNVATNDSVKVELLEKKELTNYNYPIEILYEDDYYLAVNKASNMVVYPTNKNESDTLVNALIGKFNLSPDPIKPGIIHRLDKDTTGVILLAKTSEAKEKMQELFKTRKVKKTYLAIISGVINNDTGEIDAPLLKKEGKVIVNSFGKESISYFKVLKRFTNNTLVALDLVTGRTHQLRVHLAYIGYPILGDPLYGTKIDSFNQYLHAYSLEFIHPYTNKSIVIKAPIPVEFKNKIDSLT